MVTPDLDGRLRLARLVTQRRVKLGLHKAQAAQAAGLTITTYMRVEHGQSVRDVTYAKIETALGWAAGACVAVLEGATEAQEAGEVVGGVRFAPASDVEDGVRKAVHNAVLATMPDVTAGKMAEFNEAVLKELRRLGIVPPEDDDSSP